MPGPAEVVARTPPTAFFLVSAVFHYLGPSLAVLLFTRVDALGVAWLRIASAALVLALWRRPWRLWVRATPAERRLYVALGLVLAAMNSLFYLAVERLPLATVGAVEFLGTLVLASLGARTRRNVVALGLTVLGVAGLTQVRLVGEPLGFAFAFANCLGFVVYVVLADRIATGPDDSGPWAGIDRLALAMVIAAVVATPVGLAPAAPSFGHPEWVLWGIGVGLCSSVVPYVSDQLAMARLPRATFALMLALLPASATLIGLVVLGQVPAGREVAGIVLVMAGLALHREPPDEPRAAGET